MKLKDGLALLADAVWPRDIYCICCGDLLDPGRPHALCDVCLEKISWQTHNPFRSIMDEFAFDELWPCSRYDFYTRQIAIKLKNGQSYAARNVARFLAERIELPGLLVGVPMHRSKLLKRGYNQAELLARYTARETGLPYLPNALVKLRPTASMRGSDAIERRQMLKDVFAADPEKADDLAGQDVILVDDVVTTGSTGDACARALKEAGAEKVYLLCFASSGKKGKEQVLRNITVSTEKEVLS